MPTLFERILLYCEITSNPPLSQKQRSDLGYSVYWQFKEINPEILLTKIPSIEPDGTHLVCLYPEFASAFLDNRIREYYEYPPPPKESKKRKKKEKLPPKPIGRTRKPIRQPIYSTKSFKKNHNG